MDFFDNEILPRSYALLMTEQEFNNKLGGKQYDMSKDWKLAWSPSYSKNILSSYKKTDNFVGAIPFSGDQCIVNAAILQPHQGHDLSISFLDKDQFSQVYDDDISVENIALYHAIGVSGKQKYSHMSEVYNKVGDKITGNSDWRQ